MKKFLKRVGISVIVFSMLTLVIIPFSDPIDTDPETAASQPYIHQVI